MNRTALRLSTLAALLGGGASPYPTLAKDHVFDSRMDAIDDLAAGDRHPVIIIRTDEDRQSGSTGSGIATVAGRRSIELRLEAAVLSARAPEEGDEPLVSIDETDAGLEAYLDLFEYQIRAALYGSSPWAMWWHDLNSPGDWRSSPVWTSPEDGRVRLAIREIVIGFPSVRGDCLPPPVNLDDATLDSNGDPVVTPVLPAALLKVFDYIAANGESGSDLVISMAAMRADLEAQRLPVSSFYEPMHSARMTIPEGGTPPSGEDPAAGIEAELTADLPTP